MISGLELASWWGRRPHAHAASSRDELIAETVSPLSPTSTKRAEARGFEVHNLTSNGRVVPLPPSALCRDGEASSLFVTDQVILGPCLRTGSGDEVRAGYLARAPETAVLVTLTTRHAMPPERLRDELAFEAEGFAPLAWLGDAPEDGIPYEDVLVEVLPDGARVPRAPLPAAQAIAIGVACAEAIERAGRWVGGICPETIYVDADGRFAALAPRGPRFIATAPQRMRGLRSYPVPYEGHEVLALGHPPMRASEVFSLCATIHALVTGKHPFGANLGEIVPRVIAGAHDPLPGPLGDVLARGLVSDPTNPRCPDREPIDLPSQLAAPGLRRDRDRRTTVRGGAPMRCGEGPGTGRPSS